LHRDGGRKQPRELRGAAACDIRCNGTCEVSCLHGHCRPHCGSGTPDACEMSCGGAGLADRPVACPDGSRVCGESC
jgi:hypothetical protein